MPNYVDYIILKNTFIDTWYDLWYDRDSYEFYMDYKFPEEITWSTGLFQRTWNAILISVLNRTNKYFSRNNFSWMGSSWVSWRVPLEVRESYTAVNNQWQYDSNITWQFWSNPTYVDVKYWNKDNNLRSRGRLIIGNFNNDGYEVWEITLKVNGVLVMDLKPCIDGYGIPCFYDTVRERYFYPDWYSASPSMIKTVVMSWFWQTLPIDDWIKLDRIDNRIIEVNKYDDWYAAEYNEITITADEDNYEWIEISDYTIDKQTNQGWVADFIELKPRWMLVLPRNRQITALNRPLVKWHRGDLLRIVVR